MYLREEIQTSTYSKSQQVIAKTVNLAKFAMKKKELGGSGKVVLVTDSPLRFIKTLQN